MPSLYRKNLQTIIENTLRFCNDYTAAGSGGNIWLWNEVKSRVNDILLDLCRTLGFLRTTGTIHLINGTSEYSLPIDCIRPLRFQIHGFDGEIILPKWMSQLDIIGQVLDESGDPYNTIRDTLDPGKVYLFPTPYRDGSTSARDSNDGLLRRVTEGTGAMGNSGGDYAPRQITGTAVTVQGQDPVIREFVSDMGNIQVTYIRSPRPMIDPTDYPDPGIPEWFQKDIHYGVASKLLMMSRRPVHVKKLTRASRKWNEAVSELSNRTVYKGPMEGATPL